MKQTKNDKCFEIHIKILYKGAKERFVGSKLESYNGALNAVITDAVYEYIKTHPELFPDNSDTFESEKNEPIKKEQKPVATKKDDTNVQNEQVSKLETVMFKSEPKLDEKNEEAQSDSEYETLLAGLNFFTT